MQPSSSSSPAPIRVERIACGINNCFLLSQGGSAILVDTAVKSSRKKILARCAGMNVTLILLTHGHYDHAQNAAWLAERLGVPIAMHPADIPLLGDILREPLLPTDFTSCMLIAILKLARKPGLRWAQGLMGMEIPPFAPAIALREGFSLAKYGVEATVIELPGHSPGSVGVAAGKDLLAGDAVTNLFAPGKAALYTDRAAMEASAEKIAAYGTEMTVHFGHGKSMGNRARW